MSQQQIDGLVRDRRTCLEYMLKDFVKRGGRLVTPTARPFNDPSLLDAIPLPALLRALPHVSAPLDIGQMAAAGTSAASSGPGVYGTGLYPGLQRAPSGGSSGHQRTPSGSRVGHVSPPPPALQRGTSGGMGGQQWAANGGPGAPYGNGAAAGGGVNAIPVISMESLGGGAANPFGPPAGKPTGGSANPFAAGTLPPKPPPAATVTLAPAPAAAASEGPTPPSLDLPLLDAGLDEDATKELAFWVFASVLAPSSGVSSGGASGSPGGAGSPAAQAAVLVGAVRGQLEVDEVRARNVTAALRHTPQASWSPARRVGLEGLVSQLVAARPPDFNTLGGNSKGFKGFVRWRETTAGVLATAAERGPAAAWAVLGGPTGGEAARKALARLKGALRRSDVRTAEELEEEEYSEAVGTAATAVRTLVAGAAGAAGRGGAEAALWRLPWAMRARVAEALLRALFDTLDEACAIDEAAGVRHALETVVWGALGVSPVLALALDAWVTFRQYVITSDPRLARQLKNLITKLAAQVSASRQGGAATTSVPVSVATPEDEAAADAHVAATVGAAVVEHALGRLADYHVAYPAGSEAALQGMLDVLVFAARSRGDGDGVVAGALVGVVSSAVAKQVGRLCASRVLPGMTAEARLLEVLGAVREVRAAEAGRYARLLSAAGLPQPGGLVAARLHGFAGGQLAPWLESGPQLGSVTADVLRTALEVDAQLGSDVAGASAALQGESAGSAGSVVRDALASFRRWALDAPIARAQHEWVAAQVARMGEWVARALAAEKWAAVSVREGCAQSAVEVVKLAHDAGDTLRGYGLPLGPGPRDALLAGCAAALVRYAGHVGAKLGDPARLMPPLPPVTRFKKELVAKQERIEADLAVAAYGGSVTKGHKKKTSWAEFKKSMNLGSSKTTGEGGFLECVPRVEAHTEYQAINTTLTTPIIQTCMMSLQYLLSKLGAFNEAAGSGTSGRLLEPVPGAGTSTRVPAPVAEDNPFGKRKAGAGTGSGAAAAVAEDPFANPFGKRKTDSSGGDAGPSNPFAAPASGGGAARARNPFSGEGQVGGEDADEEDDDNPFATPAGGEGGWARGGGQGGAVGMSGAPSMERELDAVAAKGPLAEARAALEGARAHAARVLATKVVFWDMRAAWLERLYRHHVVTGGPGAGAVPPPPFSTRIEPLLDGLNQVLADVCGSAPEEGGLKTLIATELLRAAAAAWARVISDGGPCRWYTPHDVPALAADLRRLGGLFEADGDGLPRPVVARALAGCWRLLAPLTLELGPLVDAVKEARLRGHAPVTLPHGELGAEIAAGAAAGEDSTTPTPSTSAGGAGGGTSLMRGFAASVRQAVGVGGAGGGDARVVMCAEGALMRALARRPERTGSKLLKKDYKLSKRIK